MCVWPLRGERRGAREATGSQIWQMGKGEVRARGWRGNFSAECYVNSLVVGRAVWRLAKLCETHVDGFSYPQN